MERSFHEQLVVTSRSGLRVAITGGGGWLGRELVAKLKSGNEKIEILALGTRSREVKLDTHTYQVQEWKPNTLLDWQPSHLVHLACRTRDYMRDSPEASAAENAHLLTKLLEEMRRLPLKGVLIASSGAALAESKDPYGLHKQVQEREVARIAREFGIDCVIARIWSVTGRYCTKPSEFLFFDLLRQAIENSNDQIHLSGPHLVARRYVDGGEYLHACLLTLLSGQSVEVNSGGKIITSLQLAQLIRDLLAPNKAITHSFSDDSVEEYVAQLDESARLTDLSGVPMSPLIRQILHSLPAVLRGVN